MNSNPNTIRAILVAILFLLSYQMAAAQYSYLLADQVNVRARPTTEGKMVTRLPIGSGVEVLSTTGDLKINGISAPWAEIRFGYDGEEATGYIWQGFLADKVHELGKGFYLVYGPE